MPIYNEVWEEEGKFINFKFFYDYILLLFL